MDTRRARSAERGLPTEVETFRQMTEVLQNVWNGQQQAQRQLVQPRHKFKTPEFNGQTDVEFFITQFTEVAEANEWQPAAALLHLRETLKEGSKDCGRAASVGGVFSALRARYGLSPREARARLSALRKDVKMTLQEHASAVDRLSQLAYADLPPHHRDDLALETFCNTLGNMSLQRHLLAIQARNLEQAVRAGNEFLQVQAPLHQGTSAIRAVEDDHLNPDDCIAAVNPSLMSTLIQLMQQLTDKVDKLQIRPSGVVKAKSEDRSAGCWGCGQEGHTRRACKINPWPTKTTPTSQSPGNACSPQQ
jgi:hypothetical protein